MSSIYEVQLHDRHEAGLNPWRYSGSDYNDNPNYYGSSCHPDYHEHLNKSLQLGKAVKVIRFHFSDISLKELRKYESDLQKKENHSISNEYYNLNDSIHPGCLHEISRKRISNKIKEMGVTPYCKNTHSSASLSKAKETRQRKQHRWYHNPQTLEYKQIATAIDSIPEGWQPGRKPKIPLIPKPRDQIKFNVWNWNVFKDDILIWSGENLSKWCKETGIKLKTCTDGYNKKVGERRVNVRWSIHNTVIENDIDTGLNGRQYAKKILRSCPFISTALKRGFYTIVIYNRYRAVKCEQSI